MWLKAAVILRLVPGCVGAAGRLYTEEDPLVILSSGSLKSAVTNSSSAWLLQFYSSWCGHCIQYSSTWKSLAQDVKGMSSHTLGPGPGPGPGNIWTCSSLPVSPFGFGSTRIQFGFSLIRIPAVK